MAGIVIIGGGQAGYSASHKLRIMGFKGSVVIVCAENDLPYQRPPLSKNFLREKFKETDFFLDLSIFTQRMISG